MWKATSFWLLCLALFGFCSGNAKAVTPTSTVKTTCTVWYQEKSYTGSSPESTCSKVGAVPRDGQFCYWPESHSSTSLHCDSTTVLSCPSGYTLQGQICVKSESEPNKDVCKKLTDKFFTSDLTVEGCVPNSNVGPGMGCSLAVIVTPSGAYTGYSGFHCRVCKDIFAEGCMDDGWGDPEAPSPDAGPKSARDCPTGQAYRDKVIDGVKVGVCFDPTGQADCQPGQSFGTVKFNGVEKGICAGPINGDGSDPNKPTASEPGSEKPGDGNNNGNNNNGDASGIGGEKPGGGGSGGNGNGNGNGDGNGDASGGNGEGNGEGEDSCPSWLSWLCGGDEGPAGLGDTPDRKGKTIDAGKLDTGDRFIGLMQCPMPRKIEGNLAGYSLNLSISFDRLCEFARYIKAVIIAIALICAARIIFKG